MSSNSALAGSGQLAAPRFPRLDLVGLDRYRHRFHEAHPFIGCCGQYRYRPSARPGVDSITRLSRPPTRRSHRPTNCPRRFSARYANVARTRHRHHDAEPRVGVYAATRSPRVDQETERDSVTGGGDHVGRTPGRAARRSGRSASMKMFDAALVAEQARRVRHAAPRRAGVRTADQRRRIGHATSPSSGICWRT